ncbi:dynein regulatory complex subunit 2-like [Venturia canescens]|uniref:dynein regulatory complex subunit 2-like n=1 Tax=Venturia canescens TaxID=32260 RepID=UPI001C9D002D|nr:dynein regulatory complex subunit 2-like [Venturia canescens]
MPLKWPKKRRESELEAMKERRISLKKEQVHREVNYGNLNEDRNRRVWRDTMMKVKLPMWREDVEVAWHTFDRSIDSKEHGANLMVDAVETARQLYERNFSSHAEAIDRFIQTYGSRLGELEDRYKKDLEYLVTNYMKDRQRLEERQNEDEVSLRSVIFSTDQHLKETFSDIKNKTIAKIDVVREKNDNSRRMAVAMLESELSSRWSDLRGILNDYENSTKQRRRTYEQMKIKDDRERAIIERQVSTTSGLLDSIRKLKDKICNFSMTAEKRTSEISAELTFFQDAYRTAKQRFSSEEKKDKARLVFLTKEYNKTAMRLKKLVEKGEKILRVVYDCSKYETEDEKILLPFYDDSHLPETQDNENLNRDLDALEITFWRRVGSARLITTELQLERSRLFEESLFLQESLRECMPQCDVIY